MDNVHASLCYFDVNWDISQNDIKFISLLDKYFDKYVCGRETSQSGHRHYQCYLISSDVKSYTNFRQKVVKEWNLSGKALKGERRQYGKVKDIVGTIDSCTSYCLKEGNYITKGFDEDYIIERYAGSFVKITEKTKYEKFLDKCKIYLKEYQVLEQSYIPDISDWYLQPEDRLTILEHFSVIYFKIYDSLIPRFKIDRILLDTQLMTHREYMNKMARTWIYDDKEYDKPGGKVIKVIHCDNCESKRTITENENIKYY